LKEYKYIGKSIIKHDVLEKVDGSIEYVGDMEIKDMLYAKLLLAKVPHANIKNIDI